MHSPDKKFEKRLLKNGHKRVFAVDEVGVGCLAGPVVACAVSINRNFHKNLGKGFGFLRESKLLSTKQREGFFEELKKQKGLTYSIAYSYPNKIDQLNIYQAARLAMKRAVVRVSEGKKGIVLIDGPRPIKGIELDQLPIIKGDRKIFAIACASIIAKVYRDKMMTRYAKRYPGYGFERHKGYGTKLHKAQLVSLGPSEIHRKSFEPVSKLI